MRLLLELLRGFFLIDLRGDVRRTYRFHLGYAVLDAAAGGILLNAPMVALKLMEARTWQLPLRELCSGLGMLATLYLSSWMARRRKMPFIVIPGVLCGLFVLAMPYAMPSAFWFLMFFSISAMFEIMTRPAITAALRFNYPVVERGKATGEVRKWSSLSFVAFSLGSAYLLQKTSGDAVFFLVQSLMVVAAGLSLASFWCFSHIRVREEIDAAEPAPQGLRPFGEALQIIARDARYRRYLAACFIDGFFAFLYFPLIWAFLKDTLGYEYVGAAAMMHVIPALTAFVVTGWLGRWFDRSNPWWAWGWIRFAWGADALLLAATPFCAAFFLPAIWLLPLVGRLMRGAVQGGQWVMWWQIGVTHFAPPGGDTSRYMGIMVFLNGAIRFAASAAGIVLTKGIDFPAWGIFIEPWKPAELLVVGGTGIVLVGVYSLVQGVWERRQAHLATIANFESQFVPPISKPTDIEQPRQQ